MIGLSKEATRGFELFEVEVCSGGAGIDVADKGWGGEGEGVVMGSVGGAKEER
jgi:hypothetical protein